MCEEIAVGVAMRWSLQNVRETEEVTKNQGRELKEILQMQDKPLSWKWNYGYLCLPLSKTSLLQIAAIFLLV